MAAAASAAAADDAGDFYCPSASGFAAVHFPTSFVTVT
jgi:hypothetical protein